MKTRSWRFRVRFNPGRHGSSGDLPGLLDMLRYDQARVETWDHVPAHEDGRPEHWVVTLVTDRYPTIDRWSSFGLVVTDTEERS